MYVSIECGHGDRWECSYDATGERLVIDVHSKRYLSQVLRPLNIKGQPTHDRSRVALIAQLVSQRSWVRIPFKA